jgi:ABC-type dipeptide/oligopeptide/nickel transport system permease subunit
MQTSNKDLGSAAESAAFVETPARVREFQRFRRVFFGRPLVIFGFAIILLNISAAVFAPLVSPYNPYLQDLANALQLPNAKHWLGTDPLGRDVVSRLIYGTQTSLMVGIIAVGVGTLIGMALGLVSGYFGGWLDAIIMRVIDAMMAIPMLVLALVFAAVLGGGLKNVMLAVGVAMVPSFCRLMRGQVLAARQADYVLAAQVVGASDVRTMLRHILPNCLPPLIVLFTLDLGRAILIEAGLSFLGIGIAPPGAAWGSMVNDGYTYLLTNPILSFAPGVCIMLVVLAFNMVGDGLRDALDPRLRGTL